MFVYKNTVDTNDLCWLYNDTNYNYKNFDKRKSVILMTDRFMLITN